MAVFNAKIIAQLLYGIPVWLPGFTQLVERVQATFLFNIFTVPRYVPYVALCLEGGQHKVETVAWGYNSLTRRYSDLGFSGTFAINVPTICQGYNKN
ncbi:Hypothetical predicted protein [Podarcis lilfordi]|uniref:Uncharacterized protein n=1 Tax=Podarcis lilfordi TaxID=74358 RepID=A0AA35LN39_9SAUR|nr:Hypothetical predicted protein [Podarcis lilfordi]